MVAHDAGGAEVLSSLLRRGLGASAATLAARHGVRFHLAGPALSVFKRKLGPLPNLGVDAALHRAGALLCGTGWQSDWEFGALRRAIQRGIPSVACLDHWTNYRERFVRHGLQCLPDALWVDDEHALALAAQLLPERPAQLLPNAYFADMRDDIARLQGQRAAGAAAPDEKGVRVLYVCEPLREAALRQHGNERHWGYTEEEALRHALRQLPRLGSPIARLVLRPHPSEARDKYDALLAESALPVRRGGDRELLLEVLDSDWVVGCNSMAMLIGLLAGKRVLCSIPPGGAPCSLPQPQIESLPGAAAWA